MRPSRAHPVEQQARQQERTEMIARKRELMAVHGHAVPRAHHAGVVDQQRNRCEILPHVLGAGAHRGERGEITMQRVHARPTGRRRRISSRTDGCRFDVAAQHNDGEVRRCEFPSGYPADAMGGAGNDRNAAHGAAAVSTAYPAAIQASSPPCRGRTFLKP